MSIHKFIEQVNFLGGRRSPFLFLIDFEMQKPQVIELSAVNPEEIKYNINGFTNDSTKTESANVSLLKFPVSFELYRKKFDLVFKHLISGDSYLANLTLKTPIQIDQSLEQLFYRCEAKYKLLYRNEFLVFSPETFVRIEDDKIHSFPMKGTIDASIENAANAILQDKKELAEHVTIVDLIRNDLSLVASNVSVKRFRYIEEIKTNAKNLFQVSSQITGDLASDYRSRLGDILVKLLPAGSVSGAPKKKTLEVLYEAEQERRGFYTGIVGYFDGDKLDSGVMIRFIEKQNDKFYYRSGGGITTQSTAAAEYQEAIDKVYVPVN